MNLVMMMLDMPLDEIRSYLFFRRRTWLATAPNVDEI
jgi:hypothetical protein